MSSDYPYGEGPTLKEFLARAEAKGIDVIAEADRAMAEQLLHHLSAIAQACKIPEKFMRKNLNISTEDVYKASLRELIYAERARARKRKRKLQKASRRRNR